MKKSIKIIIWNGIKTTEYIKLFTTSMKKCIKTGVRISYLLPFFTYLCVYCIIKLPKVAKQKRTMLHVQIGQSCKTWYQGSQERYIA